MLKALVIVPNNRTKELGSLLAVARAEARKREHTRDNPPIRALRFFPELGVYVAVFEAEPKKAITKKDDVPLTQITPDADPPLETKSHG